MALSTQYRESIVVTDVNSAGVAGLASCKSAYSQHDAPPAAIQMWVHSWAMQSNATPMGTDSGRAMDFHSGVGHLDVDGPTGTNTTRRHCFRSDFAGNLSPAARIIRFSIRAWLPGNHSRETAFDRQPELFRDRIDIALNWTYIAMPESAESGNSSGTDAANIARLAE